MMHGQTKIKYTYSCRKTNLTRQSQNSSGEDRTQLEHASTASFKCVHCTHTRARARAHTHTHTKSQLISRLQFSL